MSDSKTRVNVEVADRAASLEILDGGFQVVAQGFGSLEAELAPGLYKARASVGGVAQEQLFAVEEGVTPAPVRLGPVRFASPVPLNDTSTSHEYHQEAVARALQDAPLVLGNGARLLLSLRDPSDRPFRQTPTSLPDYARSFDGFRLCGPGNQPLIDFDQAARRVPEKGYAVLHAELDPGGYVLHWAPPGRPAVARPLPLPPNWTTLVFVMVEPGGEGALPLRPNLADCSVQMAPLGYAGYPSERYFRLTEIARQSLLQGRNIVEREVMNALLGDKFGNPLLGLLAAHLLLLDAEPRLNLLHIVLGNLGAMLGADYPDVAALHLRLRQIEHPDQPPAPQPVVFPPLLKAGWEILAAQAARDEAFFPADSLCRRMADRVVDNGVWLAWRPLPEASLGAALFAGLSDAELQGKKWRDRERILAIFEQTDGALDGAGLLQATKTLAKPVLREQLRQFLKSTLAEQLPPREQLGELVLRLARTLPWERIVARLTQLDAQGAVAARLSSVQQSLIPTLLLLRRQLQSGQDLDGAQWEQLLAGLQVPKSVLLDNLRDLARLAGALAVRLIEEERNG
ncbi:hypothetical protein [Geoalkalibacter sp.]|uniref:hypothetical protein n=1 Tax=Geoalkalibacter sp. TaxID=3041440 RepID=UPI00272E09E7|nr:hypothetical protein [Geoalkalibacter sp.]